MPEEYATLDVYKAAFLSMKGHTWTTREDSKKSKVIFVFIENVMLKTNIQAYLLGGMVKANDFTAMVKELRSHIYKTQPRSNKFKKV